MVGLSRVLSGPDDRMSRESGGSTQLRVIVHRRHQVDLWLASRGDGVGPMIGCQESWLGPLRCESLSVKGIGWALGGPVKQIVQAHPHMSECRLRELLFPGRSASRASQVGSKIGCGVCFVGLPMLEHLQLYSDFRNYYIRFRLPNTSLGIYPPSYLGDT